MTPSPTGDQSLIQLLHESGRPIYALDARRQVVYCNPALEAWLGLDTRRIVGRFVEYHSESDAGDDTARGTDGPLSGLCPPPRALAGESCQGTVSCVARDGRLLHRRAEFVPLHAGESLRSKVCRGEDTPAGETGPRGGLLAVLAATDLSPQELTAELSAEPTADELHAAIRRFRRAQAGRYAIESLLGGSSAIRRVRSQVVAAATSGANTMIVGPPGAGRAHVARAIHYHAVGDATVKLVPLDGEVLTDDVLRRAIDSVGGPAGDATHRPTLLVEQIDRLSPPHQSRLLEAIRRGEIAARIIATARDELADGTRSAPAALALDPALRDAVSTLTIRVPRLVDRLEDLPVLVQSFLEACNHENPKQVGSMRTEALDLLALYCWPGELDELRDVVAAAHRAAATHAIGPADLPAVVHHAAKAAALQLRPQERIVLDELLAAIEKEAIVRALAQAGGNKTGAADLLGLTRPRLYRRMEQLGLTSARPSAKPSARPSAPAAADATPQMPDFQELEPQEPDT